MADKKANEKIRQFLPKDVPTAPYLKKMIAEQHCYLCNREAKEGSDAWLAIKEKWLFDKLCGARYA